MESSKKHLSKAFFKSYQKAPTFVSKWLKHDKFGNKITFTSQNEVGEQTQQVLKLIAFKCPMSNAHDGYIFKNKRLYPEDLYGHYLRQDIILKHIFDFTNTDKYYDPESMKAIGVFHHKMSIEGMKVPSDETVNQFIQMVQEIEPTLLPNEYIGVHCTHGKNRTGYMIINYMCKVKGVKFEEALAAFEESRNQQKIDKEYLIEDLKRRYKTEVEE